MSTHTGQAIVRVGVQSILRRGSEILLVQRGRGYGKGTWCLPGGHLEPNETIVDCALRELQEETGVQGHKATVVTVTDPLAEAGHHMQIGVEILEWSGDPQIIDRTECSAVGFFSLQSLPPDLFPPTEQVLTKVAKGVLY